MDVSTVTSLLAGCAAVEERTGVIQVQRGEVQAFPGGAALGGGKLLADARDRIAREEFHRADADLRREDDGQVPEFSHAQDEEAIFNPLLVEAADGMVFD